MLTVILRLPDDLRGELKEPWGPVYTDAAALLADAGGPVVAVGDVVTHHLENAGAEPTVSIVDERTERSPVDAAIADAQGEPDAVVANPAGDLTAELLVTLRDALDADGPTRILVRGEEDLATLPAIVAAPDGAGVVYGQPGEGMVLVTVDAETRARAEAFLRRMEGDVERALELLASA